MNRLNLPLILLLVAAIPLVAQADDPEFGTFYPRGEDIETIVKKSFSDTFSFEKNIFSSAGLKVDEQKFLVAGRKLTLFHYYMVGEGFSDSKFESAQYLVLKEDDSKYIIFNSGFFMPECGSQTFNVDSLKIEPVKNNSDYILLSIIRILPGCPGVTGTVTKYQATYDLKIGELIRLVYDGHSL